MVIQHIAPVIAICIVAIAVIFLTLLVYLDRLLATRLQSIDRKMQPPSPHQQSQTRLRLLTELKREAAPAAPYPWNGELRLGPRAVKVATTERIFQAFQHPRLDRYLLILGAAGAGKTTLLLALAQALIQQAEIDPTQPLPVVLNLSSWTPQHFSFEQWLLTELKAKYGLRLDMGQYWLENQQLLPLLDGLDELDEQMQTQCVQAMHQFQTSFLPPGLVVCAEVIDDQRCVAQELPIKATLWLQPLSIEQTQKHLQSMGLPLRPRSQILFLAQSPLLLHFILQLLQTGVSGDRLPDNLPTGRQELLALYLDKMLGRDNPASPAPHRQAPQPSQARRWLSWLAKQMQARGQSEFLIERIQPSWLPTPRQRWFHRVIVVALAAVCVGGTAALTDGISELGIRSPVFWAVIAAAIAATPEQITLIETLSWSRQQARQGLLTGILRGAIGAVCLGILLVAICAWLFLLDPIHLKNIRDTLITGGLLSLVIVLLSGFMGALLTGLFGPVIERRSRPNHGIWRSAKNTLAFALIGFVTGTLVTGVFSGVLDLFLELISPLVRVPFMFRILYYPPVMLKTGLMIGVISGLAVGLACLQHFVLRVMLWRNGSIPWNYARFLKQMTQRQLMQQVGGRYQFGHHLLRNYLADSYSEADLEAGLQAYSASSSFARSASSSNSAVSSPSSGPSSGLSSRAVGSKTTL